MLSEAARTRLREVRRGLEAILQILGPDVIAPGTAARGTVDRRMTARARATVKRALAAHTAKPVTTSGAGKKRRAS